jgi:hypothetical protein
MQMIASQEGVDLEDHKPRTGVAGFVAGKRPAAATSLEEVEERAAKLRKVASEALDEGSEGPGDGGGGGGDEIDIDDIDAEIEEAAAEGEAAAGAESAAGPAVRDVSTKAVPAAVFGGLAPGSGA